MTTRPAAGDSNVRRQRSTAVRPSDEQLLDAACEVFAEAGFRDAAMASIAARADSTKPTLYAHFGSKDHLYQACLQREADKLTRSLFATYDQASDLPVGQQVHADMRAFFDYAAAHPHGFRLLFDDHRQAGTSRIHDDLVNTITDRVAERIRDVAIHRGHDAPTASADLLAAMLVGIAVHGARHALLVHPTDPVQAGELASNLAHMGMRHLDHDIMAKLDSTASGEAPQRVS